MAAAVDEAHEALAELFLTEDAPFDNSMAVVVAFHDWATANGHAVGVRRMREMHVRRVHELDEQCAELVLEWVATL